MGGSPPVHNFVTFFYRYNGSILLQNGYKKIFFQKSIDKQKTIWYNINVIKRDYRKELINYGTVFYHKYFKRGKYYFNRY